MQLLYLTICIIYSKKGANNIRTGDVTRSGRPMQMQSRLGSDGSGEGMQIECDTNLCFQTVVESRQECNFRA